MAQRLRKGRTARLSEQQTGAMRAPYISRGFSPVSLLDEEGLQLIEHNADTILQETGMEFRGEPEALDLLRDAGADVLGERVRFERGMCRKIIQATAPRDYIQCARNPDNNIHIGGPDVSFSPVGGPAFVHDLDRGRRYASSEDFYDLIKLAHMLPSLHAIGAPCEYLEAPIPERHLHTIFAQLYYSDKPIHGSSRSAVAAQDTLNMIRIVMGDDFVENNYCLFGGINTNSPLVLDDTMMAAAKTYARANQPVLVSAYLLAGAMGPMGLAGALAQQLAETIGSLALLQLFRPGVPCLMGTFVGAVSMKSGAPVYGTPESMLGIPIAAELARRLGVPASCAGGAVTSSKIPDAQAATESAVTLQTTFFAGVNYVSHAAGWLEGGLTAGFEKMILDGDLCSALQWFTKPLDVSENGQAMDAVRDVGPGSHFLGCDHTQRNFKTAFWQSDVADSNTFEQWSAEGQLDAAQRANKIWKTMLADYEAPAMDPGIKEALEAYRDRRQQEISQQK